MIRDLKSTECLKLLSSKYLGHLGYISDESPFVIPITYFHDADEKSILSYSANGHKIDAMRKYGHVSLQIESMTSIQDWSSVLVHGTFEELEGSRAKKYLRRFAEGVQDTIARTKNEHPKFIQDFSARLQNGNIPVVYRIHITNITGKIRNDKTE